METEPANSHWAARVGYGLAGFFLVYGLCFGPAGYLYERSHDSPKVRTTLKTIYAPILALHKTPLKRPLKIYSDWWLNLARDRDGHSD